MGASDRVRITDVSARVSLRGSVDLIVPDASVISPIDVAWDATHRDDACGVVSPPPVLRPGASRD